MQVIAHRGANKEALENSFAAFDLAAEVGASRFEFDVRGTKDHQPVIVHDRSLVRSCGKALNVEQLTRQEVEQLRLLNGEPIPFLDQMIERYLEASVPIELNLELKSTCEELAKNVASLVRSHANREKVIYSSFKWQALAHQIEFAPEVQRACLWDWDTATWPFFANLAPQVFMERAQAKIIHPAIKLVDDSLMEMADAHGWEVYSWSEMQGEEADREGVWSMLYSYDVDGHCTNYPRQMKHWLEEVAQEIEEFNLANTIV